MPTELRIFATGAAPTIKRPCHHILTQCDARYKWSPAGSRLVTKKKSDLLSLVPEHPYQTPLLSAKAEDTNLQSAADTGFDQS